MARFTIDLGGPEEGPSSKDVFRLRKAGALDEAYQIACELMDRPDPGEWDHKAMGWCLVDLVKRDAPSRDYVLLKSYRLQLEKLKIAAEDELLRTHVRKSLLRCKPDAEVIDGKDVFEKRKSGAIDEAYELALKLVGQPGSTDWDQKALGWCLVDLIKRDVNGGELSRLAGYKEQLTRLRLADDDDVLKRSVTNAIRLCAPNGVLVGRAIQYAKEERHKEAIAAFLDASRTSTLDEDSQLQFAWSLYKDSKSLMASEPLNGEAVKRNLSLALKLKIQRPSRLHSLFLLIASKLSKQGVLNILKFAQMWDLGCLSEEDYKRGKGEDGKEFPALAETVIHLSAKLANSSRDAQDIAFVLPYVDKAAGKFPDNLWLKLDKAKLLLALDRADEALQYGLSLVKAKSNEYWSWDLLGDVVGDSDAASALGCYCKALLCPAEPTFTGKVRLKLARLMIASNHLPAAKLELETVMRQKDQQGYRIPDVVLELASEPWFSATIASSTNDDFYRSNAGLAEDLLLSTLPWIDGNVGESFTVTGKEHKPKRKIFVKSSPGPIEATIPERRFATSGLKLGDAIRVKGDVDETGRYQIYVFERRDSDLKWDLFPVRVGVVDHVNLEKGVLHFIVAPNVDGVLPLAEVHHPFKQGDSIAVRLCKKVTPKGTSFRLLEALPTPETPGAEVVQLFYDEVRISGLMGFTDDGIFIPPALVAAHRLTDGDLVFGVAVISFDRKRNEWSWRAMRIDEVSTTMISQL